MTEQPTRHSLPTDVIDAVLRYLAQRPYVEVHELIAAVHAQARPDEPCACAKLQAAQEAAAHA